MEKAICLITAIISGLLAFLMIADAAVGFPFGKANIVVDILVAIAAALMIWQSIATAKEFR
jgi:zinc transporter ZupT